jgi:restriction endonuclease S subunit
LKEEQFLNMEVGLPPIDEQHRIVSIIEGLAAKVEEARILRSESISRIES